MSTLSASVSGVTRAELPVDIERWSSDTAHQATASLEPHIISPEPLLNAAHGPLVMASSSPGGAPTSSVLIAPAGGLHSLVPEVGRQTNNIMNALYSVFRETIEQAAEDKRYYLHKADSPSHITHGVRDDA